MTVIAVLVREAKWIAWGRAGEFAERVGQKGRELKPKQRLRAREDDTDLRAHRLDLFLHRRLHDFLRLTPYPRARARQFDAIPGDHRKRRNDTARRDRERRTEHFRRHDEFIDTEADRERPQCQGRECGRHAMDAGCIVTALDEAMKGSGRNEQDHGA
jgi:hypothetical protein